MIFCTTLLLIVLGINKKFLVEIPTYGGSFTEGVVGRPGFINPVIALSRTDADLAQLIYSGLFRPLPDGSLALDLASKYTVSDDGITYTVTLSDNAYFHDGAPVTADDVIFTIGKIKDPLLKSPLRASWDGVAIEKIDDKTIAFTLAQAYAIFLENLTVGIVPKHIWENFTAEDFMNSTYNGSPIGSGPYKIKNIKRNRSGAAEYYDLAAFKDFILGEPYIDTVRVVFFPDEESLLRAHENGDIDTVGGIPPLWASAESRKKLTNSFPLARIFAVFLNQNEAQIFTHTEVREALEKAVDRQKIIAEVLGGYGHEIKGPIPNGIIENDLLMTPVDKEGAKQILIDRGWKLNENGVFEKETKGKKEALAFSLSTANVPELKKVAEMVKKDWEDIGARVELITFDAGDLNQEVIRPRKYHALLFGEVVGRNPDLYAFWHSSQRLDPGLNVAQYANITADKLLEKTRNIEDRMERLLAYKELGAEMEKDIPAIFLYSPHYIYIQPKTIQNIIPFSLTNNADRFITIHTWFIRTDTVWKIFAD